MYVNQYHPLDPKNPAIKAASDAAAGKGSYKLSFYNYRSFLVVDSSMIQKSNGVSIEKANNISLQLIKPFIRIKCSTQTFDTEAIDQFGKILEWNERFTVQTVERTGIVAFELFHHPVSIKEKVLFAKGELEFGNEKDPL